MVTLGEVKEELVEILFGEGKEEGMISLILQNMPMVDKWKVKGTPTFPIFFQDFP